MGRFRLIALLAAMPLLAQTTDVGSGNVSEAVRRDFLRAYFRNGFHLLTSLPPLGDVRRASTGYRQDFPDAAKTQNVTYALIRNSTTDTAGTELVENTFQVYPDILTYYASLSASDVGMPASDTIRCPALASNSCNYQLFDKNYALFVYATDSGLAGRTFSTKDPFYTRWRAVGNLGPAASAETTVTSGTGSGITATMQRYAFGVLFNVTSGANNGRLLLVSRPVYDLYVASGAEAGFLGLPTGEELNAGGNLRRQSFEGGAIEYTPGGEAVLRLPVSSISVEVTPGVQRLNLGDTLRLTARLFAANGLALEGRAVAWVSSNPRAVAVEASGAAVTARAVGGGSSTITAVSEGRSSRGLTFFVTAPCCQVGEGAPTQAIQQSFVDAVARNRLSVRVPSPGPVRRVGGGYVQELQPADTSSTVRYLLAKPDTMASAFLVTGVILVRYLELGGPSGSLGYPLADATAAGRQLFESGALAGAPPQLVTAPVLARWAAQGYESGPAGLPAAGAETVLSFTANLGVAQLFANAAYYAYRTGPLNNRAFLVSGPILAKYRSLNGPAGRLGLPASDEFVASGRRRQEFEGGAIDYAAGEAEARVEERGRRPQIGATPPTVAPGARLRIAAGGFDAGATLRITVGNQPDILVKTQTGAFAWELFVPADAAAGLVNLRAADVNGTALAVGSYLIQSRSETLATITKLSGDLQTGFPGTRLRLPFRIAVRDEAGTPLPGLPVRFTASPGAQIELPSVSTDERGEAQAYVRLPMSEVPALATAESGGRVVTFSARSQAGSLVNFPRFMTTQTGDALLASSAAIVRFLQSSAVAGTPNGLADPVVLRQFLTDFCQFDPEGNRICDGWLAGGPNLWRLDAFTGGNLEPAPVEVTMDAIRDMLGQGAPVLVALDSGGRSHFVVAMGVNSGGSILVHDPVATLQRPTLQDYVSESPAGVRLAAALQIAPRAASTLGFLLVSTAGGTAEVSSGAGACGFGVAWPGAPLGGAQPAEGNIQFRYCDGRQPAYQVDLTGSSPAATILYSLGTVSARSELTRPAGALRVQRPDTVWVATPQRIEFAVSGILNAASFSPQLAPGALVTVFGQGLGAPDRAPAIQVGGRPAEVVYVTSFQANLALPVDLAPGTHSLRIDSLYGTQEQLVNVGLVAPALFAIEAGRGAILNQNGSRNEPTAPAGRGEVIVVYGTGLGRLVPQGEFSVAESPVSAWIEDTPVEVLYAGAAPGFPGLNQLNLRIPAFLPPGMDLRLSVEQAGVRTGPVLVTIQ